MSDHLLDWLTQKFPGSSHRTLKAMVAARRVLVNGVAARALKQPLATGDRVEVLPHAAVERDELAPLRRVHEDADVIVVDKPIGLLTSTRPDERRPTAIALIERHLHGDEAFVVHRLDQDASGLLVFAKSARAYRSLKEQFFHHSVDRRYAAVVRGIPDPPQGRIESDLAERADGTVRCVRPGERGKRAVTEYLVQRHGRGCALLTVTLHTGRKHQIRAHLSSHGHPILGDRLYGGDATPASDRLCLMAVHLAFDHPRGGRVAFDAAPPPAFTAALGG